MLIYLQILMIIVLSDFLIHELPNMASFQETNINGLCVT